MNFYKYLPYTLTLKSPAIISALGGDPNSSLTLSFIPGAAVRGAVARALGDPGAVASRQDEFHDLVLGGKVRYLNAYPSVDGSRALPVPVSFRRKKDEPENRKSVSVVDLAAFDGQPASDKDLDTCWPEEQLTPFKGEFLTIGTAQPALIKPQRSARIHHQRDRKIGRAWKDKEGNTKGAIFAFESLDAGQSFQGMIQLSGSTQEELEQTESRIKVLLGGSILVGRSRRAGYGGMATIDWGIDRNREAEGTGSEGLRPVGDDIAKDGTFRLLLTSACIVRNQNTGQIDPTALVELIERQLGNRATLVRKRWSFEPIGGFNRKWRLEVPQVLAVSAGSVFVLKAINNIPFDELLQIEHEGLGERKEEGYGRLLFLDKPLSYLSLSKSEQAVRVETGNGKPPQLVSDIEARIVWAQAMRKIEEKAAEFARSVKHPPSNSLIGRLRTPLRAKDEGALQTLTAWLGSENEAQRLKRPAIEQLERCRINGGTTLLEWTLAATESEKVLQWLNADVLAQRCHVVSEESAKRILENRSQEISVQLIDAVLAALAVLNKTKEAGDER
uniref:CRISPR-associated RAMP protein Csx10 n=1 Tax=Desulfatirhabdium butyrativorans TaxID=340467 RepID=A0A7C4MKJ4_9BACT